MLKKISIILFAMFCNAIISQNLSYKGGEIIYKVSMDNQMNTKKSDSLMRVMKLTPAMEKKMKALYSNQEPIESKLEFNSAVSTYCVVEKLELKNKINFLESVAGNGVFYTSLKEKQILNQKETFGEHFLISMPFVNWQLTQETKKIGDYLCYKATTEEEKESRKGKFTSKVTAWYAPAIPFSFGPKNYSGLPGLILELRVGKGLLFSATKIELTKKNTIQIKKPNKGIKLSQEKYNKKVKQLIQDIKN